MEGRETAKRLWALGWTAAAVAAVAVAGSVAGLRAGSERPPERPWMQLRSAPLSTSGVVDGFTVTVVAARATPFEVEVELAITGRDEAGERLHFGPMGLEFPDGGVARPASGAGTGRRQLVRFPRPTAAPLAKGDELRLWISGIVPVQSNSAPPEFPPGTALLLVPLEAVENPSVIPLGQRVPVGRAAALMLEEAWVSGSDLRLVGRLERVGPYEAQFLGFAAAWFDVGGRPRPVQSWHIGPAQRGSHETRVWVHGTGLCRGDGRPCGPVALVARLMAALPPSGLAEGGPPGDRGLLDALRGGVEVRASLPEGVSKALGGRQ